MRNEVARFLKKNQVTIFKPTWVWTKREEELIKSKTIGLSLNLCSGFSEIGDVKLDLYVESDVQADMAHLPFRDLSFDTVIFDPPWDLIPNNYPKFKAVTSEIIRVCRRRIITRIGIYMWSFEPIFSLKEVYLIKRISPLINLIAIWDKKDDDLCSYVSPSAMRFSGRVMTSMY